MKTTFIAVIASAGAAFAAASWVYRSGESSEARTQVSFDPGRPVEDRIAALEQAVNDERQARQLLQEEVLFLTEELENLAASREPEQESEPESRPDRNPEATMEERRQMFARRNSPEGRAERLVEAGFSPARAAWIVQREQELQMEALQARYEAGRTGNPADFFRDQTSTSNVLREEIGDAEYEQYLNANGRPTSVTVSSVIGSSPAQTAGLQPGDEIVNYDGERIFSMTDINMATMDGEPGQNIVVDIVRDGVPMQVVMPRGPLGITGGRRGR